MTPRRIQIVLAIALLFQEPVSLLAESGKEGISRLLWAIHHDETEEVIKLLQQDIDPNSSNRYGVTPLSLACRNGNAEVIEALLKVGANPDQSLPGGETPLMTAARTGRIDPVTLLLDAGAKVNATEQGGQDALIWAAAEGHADVVSLLLEAGANAETVLDSGFTPLLFAARDGHLEVVSVLIEAGVNVHHIIETGKKQRQSAPPGTSALRLAVENGHYEVAVALLDSGADPNDQRSGYAPLHVLTWVRKPSRGDGQAGLPAPKGSGKLSSLDFARLLVEEYEADIDLALKSGSRGGSRFGTKKASPFLLAARTADLPYMKLLHELGADITHTNEDGSNALHAISGVGSHAPEEEAGTEEDRLAALKWIHPFFDDLDVPNRNRETTMHGAAYKNAPSIARWLHEQGTDIEKWNQKNRKGWTPLLIAQGFRPGNFKPSFETIEAIEEIMRSEGVEPPPAPKRPVVGKPKKYEH